jgi:pimeloyl-ACP methyl ester carboxylesterase
MYEYFPGNYRWSFAVHNALRCGAQIGEIDRALRGLLSQGDASDEDWAAAWTGAAEAQERLARRDLERGFRISAGERLLKASVFHIAAERQLDRGERKAAAYRKSLDTYRQGAELAELGIERVEVDSPDGILPGLFIPAHGPGPHPVMIFFDGFDITKEIMAMTVRDSFRRRGISCLTVDSPGVGEPLRLRNTPSRPDYEVPAAAFIDYLETRSDVDPDRIGVMGVSLGGYYAPRAAAFEPRVRCCVAWGAILDYGATWARRWASRSPTVSVPFHQLPWVMGTDTMEEALERVKQWDLTDVLHRITQPFLLLHGELDKQVSLDDARRMFELVGSDDKELRLFTEDEGGAEHCQSDEPHAALHYICDWTAEKLKG